MKESCMISVIMSVYNTKEEWLREAIESILNQTFSDFEFIIISDCPTDGSEAVVCEYAKKDSRIKVLQNDENIGLTKSLNKGLMVAKGKYIARMDADDISVSNRFEKQVAYLDAHPDTVAVGSRCYLSQTHKPTINDWTADQEVLAIRMMFANAGLPHPSAMIRHSVLKEHDVRYTESIKKSQDYKLWTDLLPYGKLMILPDILLIYREHDQQISANKNSQYSYAHRVSLMQAEKLLGEMSGEEQDLHVTVTETDLPHGACALDRYLNKIEKANDRKQLYQPKKLKRELGYLWCRKAIRRAKSAHRFDMLFHVRTLRFMSPGMIRYIIENKRSTQAYSEAIHAYEVERQQGL